MHKEEVKKRLEEGTIQIENDAPDRLDLLREIVKWSTGSGRYYNGLFSKNLAPFENLEIIKLSEIKYFVQWQFLDNGKWYDIDRQFRIKPQPDYTNEIEALQNKAKENGQKVVIVFEKL